MQWGGVPGRPLVPARFLVGEVGAARGMLSCFLLPKENRHAACTLALWWLKFGPTVLGAGWYLLRRLGIWVLGVGRISPPLAYCGVSVGGCCPGLWVGLWFWLWFGTGKKKSLPCRSWEDVEANT